MRRIIASLDIGNHTIKLVVGEIVRIFSAEQEVS